MVVWGHTVGMFEMVSLRVLIGALLGLEFRRLGQRLGVWMSCLCWGTGSHKKQLDLSCTESVWLDLVRSCLKVQHVLGSAKHGEQWNSFMYICQVHHRYRTPMYIYIHAYIHTYTHIHTYIHTHIHTYTYLFIHSCMRTYLHTHTCMYLCVFRMFLCGLERSSRGARHASREVRSALRYETEPVRIRGFHGRFATRCSVWTATNYVYCIL